LPRRHHGSLRKQLNALASLIQIIEINAGGIGLDTAELPRKIKAARYVAAHPGEVCPAKWKEGDKTLKPSPDLVGKI
jgi:peroxiredoxin (alkyl hydroperoxide reductase subunit C)